MSQAPLLVIYGATGRTGNHLVRQALGSGLRVRAFVRDPQKLPKFATVHPDFSYYKGDVTDPDAVADSLKGADYAISVARVLTPDHPMERMVRAVIDGMRQHGVTRFVVQAGASSIPPSGVLPFNIRIMRPPMIRLMGITQMVYDNDRVIQILKESEDIQWAVTLPGLIKEEESRGKAKAVQSAGGTVTFTDLAELNLEVVQSDEYNGMGIYPGY